MTAWFQYRAGMAILHSGENSKTFAETHYHVVFMALS